MREMNSDEMEQVYTRMYARKLQIQETLNKIAQEAWEERNQLVQKAEKEYQLVKGNAEQKYQTIVKVAQIEAQKEEFRLVMEVIQILTNGS